MTWGPLSRYTGPEGEGAQVTNEGRKFGAMLLLAALAWVGLCGMALAERRLAFVVGIDRYPHLDGDAQLQRAISDADSIAQRLGTLGFAVTKLSDAAVLDQDVFLKRFAAWTREIQPGDFALFYFAGHGVSINNVNYLVPADMPNLSEADEYLFRAHALDETDIRDRIKARGAGVTLLMLDACRNNPFGSGDRSVAPTRGLARIEPSKGVLTIYSAGYGQTALDRLSDAGDPSPNSVFTRVVLSELDKPDENLLDLSENVRNRVAELAQSVGHEQVPAVDNELLGGRQIYLSGSKPVAPPPAPTADEVMWGYIKTTTDAVVLHKFIEAYPSSPHRGEADARLASLERPVVVPEPEADDVAWRYLQRTTDPDALERFIADFPESRHAVEAQERLASLAVPPAVPSVATSPPKVAPADERAWTRVATSNAPQDVRDFLRGFPQSGFSDEAKRRLQALDDAAWATASAGDLAGVGRYLFNFPDGLHRKQANDRLTELEVSKPQLQDPKPTLVPVPTHRATRRPPTAVAQVRHAALKPAPVPHRLVKAAEPPRGSKCFGFGGEQYCP